MNTGIIIAIVLSIVYGRALERIGTVEPETAY